MDFVSVAEYRYYGKDDSTLVSSGNGSAKNEEYITPYAGATEGIEIRMFKGCIRGYKREGYICAHLGKNTIRSNLRDCFAKKSQNIIDNC